MYHTTPIAIATGDIFRVIDTAIHKLRQFASNFNVHITLVIHPRKDDESQLLTLSSVSLSFFLSLSLSLSACVLCAWAWACVHFFVAVALSPRLFQHLCMPRRPSTHSRAHVPAHLNTRAPRNRAGIWLGQSNIGERQRHHFAEQWHRQIPGRQEESLRWRARVCACELCARFCGSKR